MNEPDDDARWTDATRAYLKAALPFIKQLDTNHLTTGAEQGHAAGVLAWCLHDYPIKNPNESHFGLVRADGSLKPAASVLRETFSRWSNP